MALLDETLQLWTVQNAGLAPAAVVTFGKINVQRFQRIRGQAVQGVGELGALLVTFRAVGNGGPVAQYTIPVDASQVFATVYAFDIVVLAQYVEITFTNGGVPSTLFRAHIEALPT